jgi:cytidylate kinase
MINRSLENPQIQSKSEPRPEKFSLGISGEVHGAGSSTVAKLIADILGFDYYYAGIHYREKAVEKGFAKDLQDDKGVTAFASQYVVDHPEIDIEIEKVIIKNVAQGGCVFEGKTAVVLAKAGKQPKIGGEKNKYALEPIEAHKPFFTVLLTCDKTIAAQRILVRKKLLQEGKNPLTASKQEDEEIIKQLTTEEVKKQIENSAERIRITRANWNNLYGLFELEKGQGAFDLVVDTSHLTKKQVVATIISWLVGNPNIFPFLSEEVRQRIAAEFPEIQAFSAALWASESAWNLTESH